MSIRRERDPGYARKSLLYNGNIVRYRNGMYAMYIDAEHARRITNLWPYISDEDELLPGYENGVFASFETRYRSSLLIIPIDEYDEYLRRVVNDDKYGVQYVYRTKMAAMLTQSDDLAHFTKSVTPLISK